MFFDLRIRYLIWKGKRALAVCDEWLKRRETSPLYNVEQEAVLSRLTVQMMALTKALREKIAHLEFYLKVKRHRRELLKFASQIEPVDIEEALKWLEEQAK